MAVSANAAAPTTSQTSLQSAPPTSTAATKVISRRVNGKNWHEAKAPFRKTPGLTSWAKRSKQREEAAATKKLERELKDEKKAERETWIANIKEKRARKEEKERFEQMEEKMHKKRVERVKRREKRNKLLGK